MRHEEKKGQFDLQSTRFESQRALRIMIEFPLKMAANRGAEYDRGAIYPIRVRVFAQGVG